MGADTIITAAQHWARPRPSTLHPRCQVLSILRPAPVGPPEAPPPCERSSANVQSPSQREACLRLLAPTRASRDPASSHPVALSERWNSARGAVPIRVGDSGLCTHGGARPPPPLPSAHPGPRRRAREDRRRQSSVVTSPDSCVPIPDAVLCGPPYQSRCRARL